MGREIIVSLRKDKKVVYEDYVCGRDGATNYIAQLVYNKVNEFKGDIDTLSDEETDKLYSLIYKLNLENENLISSQIIEPLQEYKDEDYKEINKAKNELSALDEARRHCGVYDEFVKFTNAMEQVQEWLDSEDYSRAGSLLEIIDKCRKIVEQRGYSDYEIWITLSE